jgi:hypothetical protein
VVVLHFVRKNKKKVAEMITGSIHNAAAIIMHETAALQQQRRRITLVWPR